MINCKQKSMRVITDLDNWKMFVKFNRKEAAGLTNYCFEIEYIDNASVHPIINWCIDNTKDLIYFEHFNSEEDDFLVQWGLTATATTSPSRKLDVYIKDSDDAILFKLAWVK